MHTEGGLRGRPPNAEAFPRVPGLFPPENGSEKKAEDTPVLRGTDGRKQIQRGSRQLLWFLHERHLPWVEGLSSQQVQGDASFST